MVDFDRMKAEEVQDYIPNTLEDMVCYLKHIFPWKVFEDNTSEQEIWTKVGTQRVIQFLENKLKGLEPDVFT